MRTTLVTMSLIAGLAFGAQAEELELSVKGETIYDDNLFGTSANEQDDLSFRLSPRAQVRDREGGLTWNVYYEPSFEYYLDQSSLRGFDHDVGGQVNWRVDAKTRVFASDRFRRFANRRRFNDSSDVTAGESSFGGEEVTERDRFINNVGQLGVVRNLTARDQVTVSGFHSFFDFSRPDRSDRDFYGAEGRYFHSLSPRTDVGAKLRWSRQVFKPQDAMRTDTDYVNLGGTFVYRWDPTLTFNVEAGPTLVLNDDPEDPPETTVTSLLGPSRTLQDITTCPTFSDGTPFFDSSCRTIPTSGLQQVIVNALGQTAVVVPRQGRTDSADTTDLTYFADLSVVKEWGELWKITVGYRRQDDQGASTIETSSILDEAYVLLEWNPLRKLNITLNGTYRRRELEQEQQVLAIVAASPVLGFANGARAVGFRTRLIDADEELTTAAIALWGSYQLNKRTRLFAAARYVEEDRDGQLVATRKTDRFVARVGIQYNFDPIEF